VYYGASGVNYWRLVQLYANQTTNWGGTFEVKNNLVYAPNATQVGIFNNNNTSATTSLSNNSINLAVNPNFSVTPPTAPLHFKPTSGSYAIGAGTGIPVFSDFFGAMTSSTPDLGAVVH
jgi:hypothetical protein